MSQARRLHHRLGRTQRHPAHGLQAHGSSGARFPGRRTVSRPAHGSSGARSPVLHWQLPFLHDAGFGLTSAGWLWPEVSSGQITGVWKEACSRGVAGIDERASASSKRASASSGRVREYGKKSMHGKLACAPPAQPPVLHRFQTTQGCASGCRRMQSS